MSARRVVCLLAMIGWLLSAVSGMAFAQDLGGVVVTRVEGPITPVVADHLSDTLEAAALQDAELVIIELDTPGGLDTSMRSIVQDILASPVPVAVHVTPPGARAASAGSVIALSAHVIAMSEGTNIGAATPIDIQGGDLQDKVINDAAAYVRALAELRGRDPEFYVQTVTEGASIPSQDALESGVIDLLAEDTADLLDQIEGMQVEVTGRGLVRLQVQDAPVTVVELSTVRQILQRLADPNLAFLLISVGTLAIVYEVANPGGGFGGAVGAVMLILAFFSLSVLPVNLAGVLLLVLAAGFFVAEAFVPGIGAFAGGGAVCLAVAGLLLFQRPSGVGVSIGLAVAVALLSGVAALALGYLAVTTRNAPPTIGAAGTVVGAVGVVKDAQGSTGQVMLEGARWQAVATTPLVVGSRVRVVSLNGLTVTVEPEVTRQPIA
ncbi:MAG: NfeD family protein [Euzebya sp.]